MKSESTKSESENDVCRCTVADRRRAALIALSRAALELDELREARERAGAHAIAADELAEHIEARLFDEARSLGVYEDEYECGCGSTGQHAESPPPADQASGPEQECDCGCSDEEDKGPVDRPWPRFGAGVEIRPVRPEPRRGRGGWVSWTCAALSVGFAFATLVTSRDDERGCGRG